MRAVSVGVSWSEAVSRGLLLKFYVQPKASKTEVVGLHGDPPRLKIRIAAPPVDGEANEELLRFLKKRLGVPMANLELIRGQSSRMKDVLVLHGNEAEIILKLTL